MVARHRVDGKVQRLKRLAQHAVRLGVPAVGQIAGQDHGVGVQGVGPLYHRPQPGAFEQRADMDVGKLHERKAVRLRGKVRQDDFDGAHCRHLHRLPHAEDAEGKGKGDQPPRFAGPR